MRKQVSQFSSSFCFVFAVFASTGCDSVRHSINRRIFLNFGKTLFVTVRETTIKNIHLDYQGLDQTLLVVKGRAQLSEMDKDRTFLVLSDDEAKIIVKLTQIPNFRPDTFSTEKGSLDLHILGSLDRTDKSIPVLLAEAIRQSPAK